MSYYPQHELSFDVPASTVTRANGGFKDGDTDVIGRWVQRGTGNTVVLVEDNGRPLGVITRITGDKVAISVGPIVDGKRQGDTALATGIRITGATRVVVNGQAAERGFVKAQNVSNVANLANARGYVIDGGGTSTADTQGTTCRVQL